VPETFTAHADSPELVHLTERLAAPARMVVEAAGYRGADVRLVLACRPGAVDLVEVSARQVPGGEPLTGAALRRVPVGELARQAWPLLRALDPSSGEAVELPPLAAPLPPSVAGAWPKADRELALAWAGLVYDAAQILGADPTRAVMAAFTTSRPTASRIVAQARDGGLIHSPAPTG
jgi:hypothetical protein